MSMSFDVIYIPENCKCDFLWYILVVSWDFFFALFLKIHCDLGYWSCCRRLRIQDSGDSLYYHIGRWHELPCGYKTSDPSTIISFYNILFSFNFHILIVLHFSTHRIVGRLRFSCLIKSQWLFSLAISSSIYKKLIKSEQK